MTDDDRRLDRTITDLRVTVAEGFAAVNARLDATKDHEPRIRELRRDVDRMLESQVSREDIADLITDAIDKSRRPRWADVGALIIAIATASGLVLTVAKAF